MSSIKIIDGVFCIVLMGLNPHTAFAAKQSVPKNFIFTLSAGPAWENAGKTQTITLAPEIIKTYDNNKSTNSLINGEVFLGVQYPLYKALHGQLGLAAAATGDAKLSGDIWDDADPQFNNHSYRYRVSHTHIAAKGKLLLDIGRTLTPWLSASAGVGFNKAHHFRNASTLFEALPDPNFSSNTHTAFTYTLGAGIQRELNKNWHIGVGYEFADWGKSRLDRAAGQTQGSGLKLSHLYTHALLFNLTYSGLLDKSKSPKCH